MGTKVFKAYKKTHRTPSLIGSDTGEIQNNLSGFNLILKPKATGLERCVVKKRPKKQQTGNPKKTKQQELPLSKIKETMKKRGGG